jgi:molecular chaperone DnaK
VDKLPGEIKSKLESALDRGRKAVKGDDMGEISAADEELSRVFAEAGQAFYAQNQPSGGGATGTPGGDGAEGGAGAQPGGSQPSPEDVVEADYEIVDEPKK